MQPQEAADGQPDDPSPPRPPRRRPLPLARRPLLTAVVLVITAAVNIAQFAAPSVLTDLERTPAGLHGEGWRTVTALLVQDGGVAGAVSNLLFLALVGTVAEQLLSRPRWLIAYVLPALAGELLGYAWQPLGAGNSVAVCGLAGATAATALLRHLPLPPFAPAVLLLWFGALLATWYVPLVVLGVITAQFVETAARRGALPPHRVTATVCTAAIVVGAYLCAVRNIHGGALLAGLVVGAGMTLIPGGGIPGPRQAR